MKLVSRYTVVLAATMAVMLSIFGFVRLRAVSSELDADMRRDHRAIGHVLQTAVADIWRGRGPDVVTSEHARAEHETLSLLERSSREDNSTRFGWERGMSRPREEQHVEGDEFVSRFPVFVGAVQVGTVIAREPLAYNDAIRRSQLKYTIGGIGAILLLCAIASLVMGSWLVGRPVKALVARARRLGRADFSAIPRVPHHDELGELSHELELAAEALASSVAEAEAETEARVAAVAQVRHADRLATVGKLAAGIAHELGTPLSVVGGHAQMIAGGEVTGEAALASAQAIDREVARMGKIVRQLLDFARRKDPGGATCDPERVARRCQGLLAPMLERQHVACEVTIVPPAQPPPKAAIGEDSLQQVLTNLLHNAAQAMSNGGGVVIEICRSSPFVRIDVRDTGPGLAPEVANHLFEPFVTTKPPGEGTGLGLAVVHGIVADHGGKIAVDSGASGTTFSLYLKEAA